MSGLRPATIFVIFSTPKITDTLFVGLFMIYSCTTFRMSGFSGSLVTAIRNKVSHSFLTTLYEELGLTKANVLRKYITTLCFSVL